MCACCIHTIIHTNLYQDEFSIVPIVGLQFLGGPGGRRGLRWVYWVSLWVEHGHARPSWWELRSRPSMPVPHVGTHRIALKCALRGALQLRRWRPHLPLPSDMPMHRRDVLKLTAAGIGGALLPFERSASAGWARPLPCWADTTHVRGARCLD